MNGLNKKIRKQFEKILNWLKNEKINKFIFSGSIIMFVQIIILLSIIVFRDGEITNVIKKTSEHSEISTTESSTTTKKVTEDEFTTDIDDSLNGEYTSYPSALDVSCIVLSTIEKDNQKYVSYSINIENVSDKDIESWAIVFRIDNNFSVENLNDVQYEIKDKNLVIYPFNSNKIIKSDENLTISFSTASGYYAYIDDCTIYASDIIESLELVYNRTPKTYTHVEVVDTTQETTEEDTPEETTPDEDTPEETTPEETTPEETTPDEDTPDEDTPEETTTDEDTPDEDTPKETTTEETTTDEDTPKETTPEETTTVETSIATTTTIQ